MAAEDQFQQQPSGNVPPRLSRWRLLSAFDNGKAGVFDHARKQLQGIGADVGRVEPEIFSDFKRCRVWSYHHGAPSGSERFGYHLQQPAGLAIFEMLDQVTAENGAVGALFILEEMMNVFLEDLKAHRAATIDRIIDAIDADHIEALLPDKLHERAESATQIEHGQFGARWYQPGEVTLMVAAQLLLVAVKHVQSAFWHEPFSPSLASQVFMTLLIAICINGNIMSAVNIYCLSGKEDEKT